MDKEIKYIGFYDITDTQSKRYIALSATNKMDYICEAIHQAGFKVHLVSLAWFIRIGNTPKFHWKTTKQINEHKRLTLCPSIESPSKFLKKINVILSLVWFFLWLLLNTRRNEKILVYHSTIISIPLRFAKKIKGFKIILEVEEIYGQVYKDKKTIRELEQKLLNKADCYIAVSNVLAEILGDKVKAIIYGNYAIPNVNIRKEANGLTNIVYAGSIEHTMEAAFNTIKCAKFLPENYIVHICGFGNIDSVNELQEQIRIINNDLSREAIKFHGVIPNDKFSDFLHSCQIAINPQRDGENMTTLFPSKIIKYLTHNLSVVSTRIKSIDKSPFESIITFSENDSPESMAKAIMTIDLNDHFDNLPLIRKLNEDFIKDLTDLFKS